MHGGGAIGPNGPVTTIEVSLPTALSLFQMPQPPFGDEGQSPVRASLRLLKIAPKRVTAPLWGAVYRSVLDQSDGPSRCFSAICGPVFRVFAPRQRARTLRPSGESFGGHLGGTQARVAGAIDLPHSPRAEGSDDLVRTPATMGIRWHPGPLWIVNRRLSILVCRLGNGYGQMRRERAETMNRKSE